MGRGYFYLTFILLASCSVRRFYNAGNVRGTVNSHIRELNRSKASMELNFDSKEALVKENCPENKDIPECKNLREQVTKLASLKEEFLTEYTKVKDQDEKFVQSLGTKGKVYSTDPEWSSVSTFQNEQTSRYKAFTTKANEFATLSNGMNKELAKVIPQKLDLVPAVRIVDRENNKATRWVAQSEKKMQVNHVAANRDPKLKAQVDALDQILAGMKVKETKVAGLSSELKKNIGNQKSYLIKGDSPEYGKLEEVKSLLRELENDSQKLESLTN